MHRSLRFVLAGISLLFLLLCLPPGGRAQEERKYTVITGTGQALYRLAIPAVQDGGGAKGAAKTATSVMNRDLTLIGLFKVLSPKGFLANLKREGTSIVAQDWINVGAQGVIKAKATATGGKITIAFYLYDVARADKPVLTKSFSGRNNTRTVRRLAHKFGDEVVKFYTGDKRGIFTTKIAFTSGNRRRRTSNIYVMDYDGYGVHRVSKTGNQNVLPAWSRSGKLAWTSFLWKNPDLFVGGARRARRISRQPGLNTGAAWSPRGNAIALTLTKDGNAEIYLISPNGAIKRRLTRNGAIDTSPSFSPDGGQIAFVSNRGGSPQIYVMSAGGGGARRLTYKGTYNQEPSCCPNGKTPLVAFTGRGLLLQSWRAVGHESRRAQPTPRESPRRDDAGLELLAQFCCRPIKALHRGIPSRGRGPQAI